MAISDYERIAKAISYLAEQVEDQPSLEEVAARVNLSPFHFQRLFCRWAGITPKRFLQVLTVERGKELLARSSSLLETSGALGLSSGSRLHDHFVQIEAVTPGEYKSGGNTLRMVHGVHETPFGNLFVALTERGVCKAAFVDGDTADSELEDLRQAWPGALIDLDRSRTAVVIEAMFHGTGPRRSRPDRAPLSVQVAGTNFQVAVWRALLRVPPGLVVSYSRIAQDIGHPGSARAVGNAVGANPVAFLIPCHRVIQQSGALGGYRWGTTRKQVLQLWERVQHESVTD